MPSLKAWFKVLLATATIVKAAPTPRPPNGVAADTSDLVGATSGSLTGGALSNVPRSESYSIFKRALRRRANSNASSVESFVDTVTPALQRTGSIISNAPSMINNGVGGTNLAATSTDNLSVLPVAGAAANSVSNGRLRTNSNASSLLSQASHLYQVTPGSGNGNTGDGGFSFRRKRRPSLASDIAPIFALLNPPAGGLINDHGEGNGQPQGGNNGLSGVNSGLCAPPL